MRVKQLRDEDFSNYKKASMFIGTCKCNWKCCTEQGLDITTCQNSSLANSKIIDIPVEKIYYRYINNPITDAIVIGGLEPILQFEEVLELVHYFRSHNCDDDIVIYTGYNRDEIIDYLKEISIYDNIVMKYGRYIPNNKPHYDDVLGIDLISDNQYGERIS